MKKFTIIFFLIALHLNAIATNKGKLTGQIFDANTGTPIGGANIVIKSLNIGTTSDRDGYYLLSDIPSGNYKVMVSCLSFVTFTKKLSIKPNQTISLNVKLKESSENLGEVTILGKSHARQLQERAMPISVITMNEIQGTVSDINDVLSKTSGIKIRATGGVGSASKISVRGLEGKRIGIFLDDSPIGDQSDFVGINDIPIDLIERIEIYKGIVPAKLGASSIGGAVNIILKEYPPKYMDASYCIQSFNSHKITGVYKRNNLDKGFEYGVGGFYTYSDNDYTMTTPKEYGGRTVKRDHDKFKKFVIGGGVTSSRWWFDEVEIEPALIITDKEIQGIENNIQEAKTFADAYVLNCKNKKKNFLISGLDLIFNNTYSYTIFRHKDAALKRYNWDGSTAVPVSNYGGEIGSHANDSRMQKHTFLQRTNLNYILSNTCSINLNSQYYYVKGIPTDKLKDKVVGHKTNFNSKMNSWISGLTFEYNSTNKKLTNALAIRYYSYNMNSILGDHFNSKTRKDISIHKIDWGFSNGIRYRFTPYFLAKLSASYDVRLPAENELLGDGFIITPAVNLVPERNTSLNLGFMYDMSKSNQHKFQVELNGFYMHLENMIRYTAGPLQGLYTNFGEMKTLGIEGEIKWDATNYLYLWGNATYQDITDSRKYDPGSSAPNPTKGKRMPNIPWLFANAGFELHKANFFGVTGQNTRLFGDCSFVEEYFYDFEVSDYQERKIPRAITFNMGLEHSLKNNSIFLSLQMNNITDKEVISEFNRPLPGRNFGAKIRYVWK